MIRISSHSYPVLRSIAENAFNIAVENNPGLAAAVSVNTSFTVFPQIWPNTAGGLSTPGSVSGQAMTEQYTTVVEMLFTRSAKEPEDMYRSVFAVYFGNSCGYVITDPTDEFFDDLAMQKMKGLSQDPQRAYNAKILKVYGMLRKAEYKY